jgi:bacteriocin-like protein
MISNTQSPDNRILTDEELNNVSGGRTNAENPFVKAVLEASKNSNGSRSGWYEVNGG